MNREFTKHPIAMAVVMAFSATAMGTLPGIASAAKTAGTYAAGDFHNHTTCSDGSTSMQKLVKKSTDKTDAPWGLDWFVQAGHGGSGNRNCTLVEDSSLGTPAYPYVAGKGPTTTWANSIGAANVMGNASNGTLLSSQSNPSMWRWQSIQEIQYPVAEYLTALKGVPVFMGVESVVAGHEHTSMSVISGQLPTFLDHATLPTTPGYTPLGNATALAQWTYCFDRGDNDNSRGGGQGWECSVTGSLNSADPSWNATAAKLRPASGTGTGERGHGKTVEGLKWMKEFHANASYYVPAHLERAGPFNPDGNNGFNVEHLRNFNNAAPKVAFGFESQPGHGASDDRGEYSPNRNTINGVKVDSVGGTTWGGTGVYAAQIGGVWDALLGEGRNWWFFANSDWHNRGSFGSDDRRTTQDFYPGEYQRNYTMVRTGNDPKMRPQTIVDGLRSGNNFAASGQLIDRLAFVACASYKGLGYRSNSAVEKTALDAALDNTDTDAAGCAAMGEKLKVNPGAEIVVAIVVRDPDGTNYSPYSFPNPSLAQVGIQQPLNMPVLDHIDVIRGMVTGYKKPGSADYAGTWPDNWIEDPDMDRLPAAAKNTTASVIQTFNDATWATVQGAPEYKSMVFRLPAVTASQYVRLRGTNLPAGVPYETDPDGNPLADVYTNAGSNNRLVAPLTIPCTATGTTEFDGCPSHLAQVNGQKMVSFDIAAWADLWFYSNPIYVEVAKSYQVVGVK
jgi:hypothetical protein